MTRRLVPLLAVVTCLAAASAAAAPAPKANTSVVLLPLSGKLSVKQPGSAGFVPLGATKTVPLGTVVDARNGRLRLTSAADGSGGTQSAKFYGGIFRVGQSKLPAGKLLTKLTLTQKLTCSSQPKPRPRTRHLWGDGKGNFQTVGRYSTVTVTGTVWLQKDTCSTTTTVVARGTVTVDDEVKHQTTTVEAGHRYVARRA
jgi:hypothetical protein